MSINSPWREALHDLKPIDLAQILSNAVNGNMDAYLRLCEEMEEREPHYRSVLGTRKLAIAGIPITVEAPTDSAHDLAIADDVEEILRRPEAEKLVLDLLDGIAKGFSCVEIIWERDVKRWEPVRYEWRSQRHFILDRDTLTQPRLRTPENMYPGDDLQPFKWLVHRPTLTSGPPGRGGIAMPASLAYMAKKYTIADWLTFLDVFGMPVRLGTFPPEMQKRKSELLRAIQQIGTDAAAVIPKGMEVQFLEAKGSAAGGLFQNTAEYWDKQTSKVVLGQTMSSDDGASLSQAKVHQEVRREIRDADARAVAATITRDLIIQFIQLNYGPQGKYPRAAFKVSEPEDVLKVMQAVAVAVDLGVKLQMTDVRDRLGFGEPEEGSDVLWPAALVISKETAADPKLAAANKPAEPPPAPDDSKPPKVQVPASDQRKAQRDAVFKLIELFKGAPKTVPDPSLGTDAVDEARAAALEDWHKLIDPNVGVLLEKMQAAKTFAEATESLQSLAEDAGVELDIESFVSALARSDFKLRGVGDATDRTVL